MPMVPPGRDTVETERVDDDTVTEYVCDALPFVVVSVTVVVIVKFPARVGIPLNTPAAVIATPVGAPLKAQT